MIEISTSLSVVCGTVYRSERQMFGTIFDLLPVQVSIIFSVTSTDVKQGYTLLEVGSCQSCGRDFFEPMQA